VRPVLLQLFRLAVLVAIAWIVRAHAVRVRIEGDAPITLKEVASIFPNAAALVPDASERRGMYVHDPDGHELGYVLRTMPDARGVIGYRGWTDTLVAFDPALKVVGVRLRDSQDTRDHVQDVRDDRYFMKTWNGKSWDAIARTTPEGFGIEGVSGASMTSVAMAEGIMRRLAASNEALAAPRTPFRLGWKEGGVIAITLAAIGLSMTGTHGRRWRRRGFQVAVIAYIGFISGDLLAQSLIVGWTQNGVPWRTAPGLVLLLAAALVVPWTSGKPLYCQHLCPHGAAQEILHGLAPKRWRIHLRREVDAGLRWFPPLLLGLVLTVAMLGLPLDLAHLEPFDAYVLRAAGVATISIAVAGLVASLFVPMAYCHYGCPTGVFLNFIRRHGRADRFGTRDVAALLLLALAAGLAWFYQPLQAAIVAI
jgi:NosR/NirI family nitrous oxide reductase transcriptional regulator